MQALGIEDGAGDEAEPVMSQMRMENGYMELLYVDYIVGCLVARSEDVSSFLYYFVVSA